MGEISKKKRSEHQTQKNRDLVAEIISKLIAVKTDYLPNASEEEKQKLIQTLNTWQTLPGSAKTKIAVSRKTTTAANTTTEDKTKTKTTK